MPKTRRTVNEVEAVKQEILTKALQLIIDEGYSKLTMRKIAKQLDIAAATIYNYFSNKEEINLWIRIKGFEILAGMLSKAYNKKKALDYNLRSSLKAYFKFGTIYSEYYDIMFNLRTPKVSDYIGTEFEEIATTKLQMTGRKCFAYFSHLVSEVYKDNEQFSEDYIRYRAVQIWTDIHGMVSLYNSHQIAEMVKNPKKYVDIRIESVIQDLIR